MQNLFFHPPLWKYEHEFLQDYTMDTSLVTGLLHLLQQLLELLSQLFFLARLLIKTFYFFFCFDCSVPSCLSVIQSYLHSMNIIHRDLNSHNCLVREVRTRLFMHMSGNTLCGICKENTLYTCICQLPGHFRHIDKEELCEH